MISVGLPVERVEERIAPYGERVPVAAVNSPAAVVVFGEPSVRRPPTAGLSWDGDLARSGTSC
jgi:hypothetical protein